MSLYLLKPTNGQPKKPSEIRDNFQHILGAAIPDCILPETDRTYGGKLSTIPNALGVTYTSFDALIGGKLHQAAAGQITGLSARRAQILYAAKNTNTDQVAPTIGTVGGTYPTADANTIVRYTLTEASNPRDTSGNNNHIATMTGTTRVDGWNDYARYFSGSDYMLGTATTNIPTGTAERELVAIFTPSRLNYNAHQYVAFMGSSVASQAFAIAIADNSKRLTIVGWSNDINTGLDLELGRTYIVHAQNKQNKTFVYVNGVLVAAANHTLNTAANVPRIGCNSNNAEFFQGTVHYYEIRNKIRTQQQINQICNKWGMGIRYMGPAATYPRNPSDTGFHVWKFDETSGTSIADANTSAALNFTASGTSILDSEIGLGKSRYFNGSTDKATTSAYAFPSTFTVIFCGKVDDFGATRPVISNRPSGNGDGVGVFFYTDGTFGIDDAAGHKGTYHFPTGKQFFAALVVSGGTITFYEDAPVPTSSTTYTARTGSLALTIGYDIPWNTYFKGNMDYLAVIPRAMNTAEIGTFYNSLMRTVERSIVDDLLPANSIALGYIRTDSSRVIELDDFSYKYGRNEGISKSEGNKRVILPWRYWSGATDIWHDNPLGMTERIRMTPLFASDMNVAVRQSQPYGLESDGSHAYNMIVNTQMDRKIHIGVGTYIRENIASTSNGTYIRENIASTSDGTYIRENIASTSDGYVSALLEVI